MSEPRAAHCGAASAPGAPLDRGALATERENEASRELDQLDARAAVALFAREDRAALDAVDGAAEELARAVDALALAFERGGRLLYVGAGTSGRLALLDAVECPPTFGSDPAQVQALLAGGPGALLRSVEGAEDDAAAGRTELAALQPSEHDVVVGVTAGGTTAYVHGALAAASEAGATAILLACVPRSEVPDPPHCAFSIRLLTGPELVTGSTRLKAGTATKLALNTLSTLAMVRIGKVHGNLMVDVNTRANTKLVDRGERIVMRIAGVPREDARTHIAAAQGEVKLAALTASLDCDVARGRALLTAHGGKLRAALAAARAETRPGDESAPEAEA